jgi:diguanylate cyclase (GGDEF)-like protein
MSANITPNADSGRALDPLTGLANRIGVEQFLADFAREGAESELCLMTLELSRFGNVNDSLGAELGDKIISTVAKRLLKIFPQVPMVARTHGDHFCIVFTGDVDINEQIELLSNFTQRPLAMRGEVIVMSIRVGVAVLGAVVNAPSELLHAAEVALHRAKLDQVKRCFYRRDMETEAKAVHQLANDLRISLVTNHEELHKAIANEEFLILYQPIVDTSVWQVHAMEALIRWRHPKRGMISPANFIPMAEQIQVMDVLGSWIMRRACRDAMTFPLNPDGTRPGISINVSATQFIEPGILLATVEQALAESGIEPNLVELEITESTAFGIDKLSIIDSLRALGCKVSLDDFGTGFSSLTQLNVIPLDYIKLDRSFIMAIGGDNPIEDRRSDRITRAALSIAETFDLNTIVEGVETQVQSDRVQKYGAHLIQGYLYSKPLPLAQACEFITTFNTKQTKGAPHG